ncbi:MAG: MarR family transcriptional regulator, partial [Calditrichaeota bacterium]|nr:MarR family transcriptional regulator [Calditrichota bacterium]
MKAVEHYFNEVLGIAVHIRSIPANKQSALPLFLKHIYAFNKGKLLNREIIFLEKKSGEHLTVDQLRKHSKIVEKAFNRPVVFVLPFLQSYNRKRLIQKQVAFIIPGKQLFIPQLLIDLREFRQSVQKHGEKLLPAAQCLLLFHLIKENIETLNLKTLAKKLDYTQTTISRAARVLVENDIAKVEGKKEKWLILGQDKEALWRKALPLLQSPVKKLYYLDNLEKRDSIYKASYSALSFYTDMAEDDKKHLAVSQSDFNILKEKKQIDFVNSIEGAVH